MSETVPEVTIDEAIARVGSGVVLIDVREPEEWEAGHAVGAVSIPMSQFAERQDEFPREDEFLVICQAGARSLRVATALAASGYSPINVAGGTSAWQSAGGAMVADGPAPERA